MEEEGGIRRSIGPTSSSIKTSLNMVKEYVVGLMEINTMVNRRIMRSMVKEQTFWLMEIKTMVNGRIMKGMIKD